MNDLWLFLGGILFLFVVWVYAGGPNNPISFAGPYITPVTAPGVTQVGYGGSANQFLNTGSNQTFGYWSGNSNTQIPAADRSPLAGKVRLSGGNTGATDPRQEYVTLYSNSSAPIPITGWRLVSLKTGSSATIPVGALVAQPGGNSSRNLLPITLSPHQTAYISSGRSPVEDSFLETKCTGYLNTNNAFSPSLSQRCPSPVSELGAEYGGDAALYDQCQAYVSTLSSCRVPSTDGKNIANSCQNFVNGRLNYDGCLAAHRSDSDFYGSTWRIYLDSRKELWRVSNETIELLDANGKVVDVYSY